MKDAVSTESEIAREKNEKTIKENKIKKTVLTVLIALSYLCMGCYRTIPGPTLFYLKQIVQEKVSTMPVIFVSRSFGYLIGYIVGGLAFDYLKSPRLRHAIIIGMKTCAGISAIGVPFCKTLASLSITFFAAGICISVLDVGFNTYLLFLWKGECHMYFQIVRFVYATGSIIGPCLARNFIDDIQSARDSNSTESVDKILGGIKLPKLMYAYVFLACMIGIVTVLWIIMLLIPSTCHKTNRKIGLSARVTSKSFFIFSIITTLLLAFIVGSIDLGYQHMLSTYAFTAYGLSTVQSADLTFTFWICYMFGSLVAVFLSFRFHPFCMILCNLVTEFVAAIILIMLAEISQSYIFLGNALLGFGSSSLLASTVLWFYSYVKITHKIMSVILLSEALAEMIIPEILSAILWHNARGLFYFLLAVPVLYFIIFMIQCCHFFPYGERYLTKHGKRHNQSSRFRICPIYVYPPLKLVSMDSQTDYGEDLSDIFEPRNKDSMAQTDAGQKKMSSPTENSNPKQTDSEGQTTSEDAQKDKSPEASEVSDDVKDHSAKEDEKDSQKDEKKEEDKPKRKFGFGGLFRKKEEK